MQVIKNLLINGASPVTVGGTGTTQKVFPYVPGPSIGVAANSSSPFSGVGAIAVPGNNEVNGQNLVVLASGNFEVGAGGACPNFTVKLLAATSAANLAAGTYTTLGTSGLITAQNLLGTFYPWSLEFEINGDSGSGIVQGSGAFLVDGTYVGNGSNAGAQGVMGTTSGWNQLSGINFSSGTPAFYLAVGVTFSVSESGNSANMYQFQLLA